MESSEMKRDKEWLTNQIEIMGRETSENYPPEQMVDREVVLNLIDQLDEQEKVELEYVFEAETRRKLEEFLRDSDKNANSIKLCRKILESDIPF